MAAIKRSNRAHYSYKNNQKGIKKIDINEQNRANERIKAYVLQVRRKNNYETHTLTHTPTAVVIKLSAMAMICGAEKRKAWG